MKRILMTLCAALALGAASAAETTPALGDEKSLYDLLDLDRPGMEAVKKAVAKGNVAAADKELLKYFRTRKPVELFGLDLENVKVSKLEQKQADEALEQLLGRFEYALVAALCAAVALVLLSVMLPLLGVLSAVGG